MKNENRVIQIYDRNIGKNIKKLREQNGLLQTDVLTQLQLLGLDISIYSYSKIESGKQNPTVSLLTALTEVLACDYNDIFKQ